MITSAVLALYAILSQKPGAPVRWIIAGYDVPTEAQISKLLAEPNETAFEEVKKTLRYESATLDNGCRLLYDRHLVLERDASLDAIRGFIAKAAGKEPVKVGDLDPAAKQFAFDTLRQNGQYRNLDDEELSRMNVHVGIRVHADIAVGGRKEQFLLDKGVPSDMIEKLVAGHFVDGPLRSVTNPIQRTLPKFHPSQVDFIYSSGARLSFSELELATSTANFLTKLKGEYLKSRNELLEPVVDDILKKQGLDRFSSRQRYNSLDDLNPEERAGIENNIQRSWQAFGWDSPTTAAKNWSSAKLIGVQRGLVLEYGMPSAKGAPGVGRSPLGTLSKIR